MATKRTSRIRDVDVLKALYDEGERDFSNRLRLRDTDLTGVQLAS